MEAEYFKWVGLGLCLLALFLVNLFHISLGAISKISLPRFLEEKDKKSRTRTVEIFDNLKISVEFLRNLFLIAALVFIVILFPRLSLWPLWLFLISFGGYLVLIEILPRLIAAAARKQILLIFLPSAEFFHFIARPFLFMMRTTDIDKEEEVPREATDEEIQALIEEATDEGIIETDEGELLKSVVEFGDTIVREIMTPRVSMICIRMDSTIKKLRDLVIREKHSRIPVYKDRIDNIEGIIVAKDLLEFSEDVHQSDSIKSLVREAYFVPESMRVSELLEEFQKRALKMAIVVDEHGGVSGLVTMEDLMEEIVGEIQDEYDKEETLPIKNAPGDYSVVGDLNIEDVEDLFDIELEEDDYVTIGGLITHIFGRLPEKGESLELKGLSFEVLEVDQKRIRKLRIKKIHPES